MSRTDGNTTQMRSLHNEFIKVSQNINAEIAQDLHNLQKLYYDIFSKLLSYMENYSDGFFDTYLKSLPEDTVVGIISQINNAELFDTRILENPSLFIHDRSMPGKYQGLANEIMDVIKQTLTERERIVILEAHNEECKTFREILEDPEKLEQYIKEVQSTSYLFTAEATYTQPIEIKLWYRVYLERHGPPGDGVFDSEILGNIIQELIASGLVSEDDVAS